MSHSIAGRRGRQVILWGILTALVLLVIYQRATVLRYAASWLVVDETSGEADMVVITYLSRGDDRMFDLTAELVRQWQVRRVLLLEGRLSRSVRVGAAPGFAEIVQHELVQRQVPESAVEVLNTDACTVSEAFEALGRRLDAAPPTVAILLCDRLQGSYFRAVTNEFVPQELADRVRIRALRVRGHDETNWWRSATGVKDLAACSLRRLHFALYHGNSPIFEEWDPDQFETKLLVDGPAP